MTEQELEAKLAALREELIARFDATTQPICVTPDRACERFSFARATFDRWLADPNEGLESGPQPVVLRPNGPGGKVLVHVARMQEWLDGRRHARRRT